MKLRSPNISDIDDILQWENDSDFQHHSSKIQHYSRSEIEHFIIRNDNLIEHNQQRLMILRDDGKAVGCVDLYDFCATERRASVGILVYRNQRCGIGLRALELLADYVSRVYRLRGLRAEIPEWNIASRKCFEKAGYEHIREDIFVLEL